jgi:hypothetical protein
MEGHRAAPEVFIVLGLEFLLVPGVFGLLTGYHTGITPQPFRAPLPVMGQTGGTENEPLSTLSIAAARCSTCSIPVSATKFS